MLMVAAERVVFLTTPPILIGGAISRNSFKEFQVLLIPGTPHRFTNWSPEQFCLSRKRALLILRVFSRFPRV